MPRPKVIERDPFAASGLASIDALHLQKREIVLIPSAATGPGNSIARAQIDRDRR
jgi:hypothetical protein